MLNGPPPPEKKANKPFDAKGAPRSFVLVITPSYGIKGAAGLVWAESGVGVQVAQTSYSWPRLSKRIRLEKLQFQLEEGPTGSSSSVGSSGEHRGMASRAASFAENAEGGVALS